MVQPKWTNQCSQRQRLSRHYHYHYYYYYYYYTTATTTTTNNNNSDNKNNNDNNNNRCVFLILRIFNPIQSFSWWNNSLIHDFLFYLNTFEHFVQNNLMSYKEETVTMTSFIMFQSWRHVTILNSLKSFNKRILGIQFHETFPTTVIISDFHDGESVVIREL